MYLAPVAAAMSSMISERLAPKLGGTMAQTLITPFILFKFRLFNAFSASSAMISMLLPCCTIGASKCSMLFSDDISWSETSM